MKMDNALSRLSPDDLCIVVLAKDGRQRQAVWVPHLKYFRYRDEPAGTAELHDVDEWWPVAFKR